jgi:hypothetical protein
MKTTTSATVGLLAGLLFSPGIAGADAVLDWNAIMVTVVSDQPPPFKNRFAAIMHLAVFDAVNAVKGEYKPYLGAVMTSPDASADAAAVAAAHTSAVTSRIEPRCWTPLGRTRLPAFRTGPPTAPASPSARLRPPA